jgi:hypothetical protein
MAGTAPYGDELLEQLIEDGRAIRLRTVMDLSGPQPATIDPAAALRVPAPLVAMAEELGAFG